MKERKYRFVHITDLAKIEDEDILAFQEELPDLIASLKSLAAIQRDVYFPLSLKIPHVDWENDGISETEVSVRYTPNLKTLIEP